MAAISIRHTLEQASREMQRRFSASNLKFAVAKTLTDLAGATQQEVRADLPRKFVIRRNWVPQGIRIRPASKSNLESVIYSIDSGGRRDFMGLQATGGVKAPKRGSHIAIPLKAVKPTPQTIIQQGWKPKNLLRTFPNNPGQKNDRKRSAMAMKAQAIKVTSRKNPAIEIILMKKGGAYVPAWLLVPSAKIKDVDFMSKPALKVINSRALSILKSNIFDATK